MLTPTILFLDDQLVAHQRTVLQRYLNVFQQLNIDLLEVSDINLMYDKLKEYQEQGKTIHGFLIDLMLPQCQPKMNFAAWGVPSLSLNHSIGGAQVIKLMRHEYYEDERNNPAHPLHIMQYFKDAKIALFTTYEDGEAVMRNQGIAKVCNFLYKDQRNIEELLTKWIQSCNP